MKRGLTFAVLLAGLAGVALAVMRHGADSALGTKAQNNLSRWNHFFSSVSAEDSRDLRIPEGDLPALVLPSQVLSLRESAAGSGRLLPEVPHFADPWGYPITIHLVALVPRPRWRIRSRVSRSLLGQWVESTIEIAGPDESPLPTAPAITPPAGRRARRP